MAHMCLENKGGCPMNIRRRIFSVLLVLCMVFGCCTATADTELTQETAQTAETSVVLDLGVEDTAYTIVIPSRVNLDREGKGTVTITLKSGFVLSDITELKVRMIDGYTEAIKHESDSSRHRKANMTLYNTNNSSTVACEITSSNETYIQKSTNLIYVTNKTENNADVNRKLNFEVTSSMPSYGKYVGTLTFSVVTA